jgi:hypothetical protein
MGILSPNWWRVAFGAAMHGFDCFGRGTDGMYWMDLHVLISFVRRGFV